MEKKCAGKAGAAEPCQAEWLSHFAFDTGSVLSSVAGTTDTIALASTATALRMANQELAEGRDQVQKILVVISDSLAQDAPETADIASDIKAKARLVFVPATKHGVLSHHTLKLFGSGKGGDGSISLEHSETFDEEDVKRLLSDGSCSSSSKADQAAKPAEPAGTGEEPQQHLPWQTGAAALVAPQSSPEEAAPSANAAIPPVMTALASHPPVAALQSAASTEVGSKRQAERDTFWRELTRRE